MQIEYHDHFFKKIILRTVYSLVTRLVSASLGQTRGKMQAVEILQ